MDTYNRQAIALLAGAECAAAPADVSSDDLMERVDRKFGLRDDDKTAKQFERARSTLSYYLAASSSSAWPQRVHHLLSGSHAIKIMPVAATELPSKEPVRESLRCQFCNKKEHCCSHIVHIVGGTGKFHASNWLAAPLADLKCKVCAFDKCDQLQYLGAFAIGETCLQRLVHHYSVSTLLLRLIWHAQRSESAECGYGDTVDPAFVNEVAGLLEAMHVRHHDATKPTPVLYQLEFGDDFWASVFGHVTNNEFSAKFLERAGEIGRENLNTPDWEVHDSEDDEEDDEEEPTATRRTRARGATRRRLVKTGGGMLASDDRASNVCIDEEEQEDESPSNKRRRVLEDDKDDDLPSPPQRRVTRASSAKSANAAKPPSRKERNENHAIVLDDDEIDEADGQEEDLEELDAPEEVAPPTEDEDEEDDAPSEPVGEATGDASSPPQPRRSRELLSDLLEVIAQSELDGERLDLLRLATEFQRLLFFKNNNFQMPSPGSPVAVEASKAVTMGHELVALSRRAGREVHAEVVGDVVTRMCGLLC